MTVLRGPRGVNLIAGETITLAALAARTVVANAVGATANIGGERKRFIVVNRITASATDAGDTLDVYVDFSLDGAIWYNAIHFTQKAGNTPARTEFAVLDPSNPGVAVVDVTADAASGAVRPALFGVYMRARWTVVEFAGAGAASHTFSVIAYAIT
ncbi:MAG: hypothetical protein FJZ90_00040 [Chloroflexi bacterium]|nr:hypothetical protein [Chloroflexota bacterium]